MKLKKQQFNLDLDRAKTYVLEGKIDQAINLLFKLEEIKPDDAEVKLYLGSALTKNGEHLQAIRVLKNAIEISPDLFNLHYAVGVANFELKNYQEALQAFEREINLNPKNYFAYLESGYSLYELEEYDAAINFLEKAITLDADCADAYHCMGATLNNLERYQEAFNNILRAIEIDNTQSEYYFCLGNIFASIKNNKEALKSFEKALEIDPLNNEIIYNKGLIHFYNLNFKEGWECYEKRRKVSEYLKKSESFNKLYLKQIPEDHEPILLYSEQGIGDQIIYLSLLHEAIALPNPILVQIEPRLIPLFKRSYPAVNFYSDKESLDPSLYKYHALVGSIPHLFRNSKESFLNQKKSFLISDPHKTLALRNRLTVKDHLVCGIAWKSKNEKFGHFKTASLTDFLPVLKLPSINFIDLQYGDTSDDRLNLKNEHSVTLSKIDDIDNFNDIDGLASLIDACDFIVTISNVTAHIAGALGKKVFLMVPYEKGRIWYWHDGLKISLWYPTIQIFTQNEMGNWSVPINEIKEKIVEEILYE